MIAPRQYMPIEDFRQLVFQLRCCLGTSASIIIESFLGSFVDNILPATLEHWVVALQELARIERQEMTLEEYDEMMWPHEDNEEDHEDEDFDPTMME